jgi:hypothetical protein
MLLLFQKNIDPLFKNKVQYNESVSEVGLLVDFVGSADREKICTKQTGDCG